MTAGLSCSVIAEGDYCASLVSAGRLSDSNTGIVPLAKRVNSIDSDVLEGERESHFKREVSPHLVPQSNRASSLKHAERRVTHPSELTAY